MENYSWKVCIIQKIFVNIGDFCLWLSISNCLDTTIHKFVDTLRPKMCQFFPLTLLVISCTKNWGLRTSNKEDGWDDCVCSVNFLQPGNYHIFITYIHKWEILTDTPKLSMYFLVELSTSHVINKWNKLDPNICSSSNYHLFCPALLKLIRPVKRKIFNINDPFGIKLLTRLKLGFSHFPEHKFRRGFKDTLNTPCFCSIEAETTTHYFLHCNFYNSNRATFINDLENISFPFLWLVVAI